MYFKLIFLSCLTFCFLACKSSQEPTAEAKDEVNRTKILNCPEGGNCTFEVLQNKSLVIKTDGIGAKYPQVTDGKHTVIKFEYKKDKDPSLADDGYSEVIYAEIEQATESLSLIDIELNQAKVLFGRLCFCRGQTGYYRAEKGQFEIKINEDESVTYTFNLEIKEVPQLLKEVSVIQK